MKEEKRQRAPIVPTIIRAFKIIIQSDNIAGIVLETVWMFVGILISYTAVINSRFFDSAADMLSGKNGAFKSALMWLGVWMALEMLTAGLDFVYNKVVGIMQIKMGYYIEKCAMDKIGRIRLRYFDDRDAQKKIRLCKNNFGSKVSNVTENSTSFVRNLITFLSTLAILLKADWKIAAVITVCVVPGAVLGRMKSDKYYELAQFNTFEGQMQDYLAKVITKRKYIKEMRFYQLYDYIGDKYAQSVKSVDKQQMKLARTFLLADSLTSILTYGSIAAALAIISWDIFHGRAGIGSFVLVYTTVQNMQSALSGAFSNLNAITDNGRYLEDYETVLAYEEEPSEDGCIHTDKQSLEIRFEHVSFTYPGTEREVLSDINLTIRQGEKIAIVGENGSGKSTFVSLLEGLYEPTKGRILINGTDIRERFDLLRNSISCTLQEFLQLEGSLAENVRIGDAKEHHSDEDVRQALDKAGLLEEAVNMPDGIHTVLGNFVPGGVDLSGGQWQKLAMARNLIKTDARIMIMDEPTAALDPIAESNLYRQFQSLTADRTVLLISHRLGAARLADRILVFEDGQIKEDGTHESLLKKDGKYTEMYHAQAQWYTESA